MSDDERAIRALVSQWMEASRTGDTATLLSLMTEDVVFMVPGREPFGRERFETVSQAQSGMKIEGTNAIVELQVIGDWAFSRNCVGLVITPSTGPKIERRGYTLTLFQKGADRRWRLARDANLLT